MVGARVEDHTEVGAAAHDQRDRHTPVRQPAREIGGAVDRIDDPACFCGASEVLVTAFFAEKCVSRKGSAKRRDDQPLHGAVRRGQDVLRTLLPNVERVGIVQKAQREPAGVARDRFGGTPAFVKLRSIHSGSRESVAGRRMAARA